MICFARLKRGAFFYRSISLQQPVVGVCPQGRLGLRNNTPSLDRIDQLVTSLGGSSFDFATVILHRSR